MIISFRMKNFGPFRDETVVDFRSTKLKDSPENVLELEGSRTGILNGVSLFGPNASGKSYVIRALASLTNIMRFPLPVGVPIASYAPFAFSKDSRAGPVELGIRMVSDGVMYDYNVGFDSTKIISESLYRWPKGQRSKVFARNGAKYSCARASDAAGLGKIIPMTAENSSFLSVAAQFNNILCMNLVTAVSKIAIISSHSFDRVTKRVDSDLEFRKTLLSMLSMADFDVDDLNRPNESFSSGTDAMIGIMGAVIDVLREGGVAIIDDFGAFLHHDLCAYIIGLFRSESNPNRAQFVVCTHDLNLMDVSILRRDQMLMIDRDRNTHASKASPLSDFSIHKGSDIQKAYMNGQYGAVPIIGVGRLDMNRRKSAAARGHR